MWEKLMEENGGPESNLEMLGKIWKGKEVLVYVDPLTCIISILLYWIFIQGKIKQRKGEDSVGENMYNRICFR